MENSSRGWGSVTGQFPQGKWILPNQHLRHFFFCLNPGVRVAQPYKLFGEAVEDPYHREFVLC